MKTRINGEAVDMPVGISIKELICRRRINPKNVVVEYNRVILKPQEWGGIVLKEGDTLEIIAFVGGG